MFQDNPFLGGLLTATPFAIAVIAVLGGAPLVVFVPGLLFSIVIGYLTYPR